MAVRRMRSSDVADVSRVVIESFMHSVAPDLSEQGIATFLDIAAEGSLAQRMSEDNIMLVYEKVGVIQGYAEVKEGRHIAMLFVDPAFQRHGIGRNLIAECLRHCAHETVTVSASLNAVGAYLRFGFEVAGPEDESQGLKFRPMTKKSNIKLEPTA